MSVDPVVARAVERAKKDFAKTKKAEKGTSSWGSLLSFAGLAPKADEPPAELLFDAFVDELNKLTRVQLLAVMPPTEGERRRVYASAATVVAMQMVPAAGLDADDLFDRCNAVYASLSKAPQTLVEHAKLMIDWMEWRLSHEHLYDTALFYVVEAEYQLHDAKSGGLLTRPSEATIQLADAALKTAAALRARVVERVSRDVETLSEAVAKHEKRVAALQEREKQIEQKINNL